MAEKMKARQNKQLNERLSAKAPLIKTMGLLFFAYHLKEKMGSPLILCKVKPLL
ncbi:hypothetical protein MUB16_35105 [Priestia sp. OVL9]|nr:hypothetical protein [Priestia sp. OVL9]